MRLRSLCFAFVVLPLIVTTPAQAQPTLHYTVSMDHPDRHLYHVVLTATNLKGPVIDLRIPAWMPGYYQILDYAKNLSNFRTTDERGQPIPWEGQAATPGGWLSVNPVP